jgi:hypothetical protein
LIVTEPATVDRARAHGEAVQDVLGVLGSFLMTLDTADLRRVAAGLRRSLDGGAVSAGKAGLVRRLASRELSQADRVDLEQWALIDHFRHREQLLQGALSAPEVAQRLGITRQAAYDRAKRGSLLAVMDRGALRFPGWQFDPEGDNGVVPGLPRVARALRVPPLGKISWMVRPNAYLGGVIPLDRLRAGQVEEVVDLARGVELA